MDQFDGIQDITDRNDVVLRFDDHGIFSSTGQSIAWTRDEQGRITEIVDPEGNAIHYTYDARGDLVERIDQVANRQSMTYLADPAHYLGSITDARGIKVLSLEYDEEGRVIAAGDALGNAATRGYDLENNQQVIGDLAGNETTVIFDRFGNITSAIDPVGNTVSFTYNGDRNQTSSTDGNGVTSTFTYDAAGNQLTYARPDVGVFITTYNEFNEPTSVLDPEGRLTQLNYDQRGNLVELISAAGVRSTFTRDTRGRPIESTDQFGLVTTYEYSEFAEPTRINFPDGTFQAVVYSGLGVITSATNEQGHTTLLHADQSGRIVSLDSPAVSAAVTGTGFTASAGSTSVITYDGDTLKSYTDELGRTTTYEYDDAGRPIRVMDPAGREAVRTYDGNGRILSETDGQGRTTYMEYDGNSRLTKLIDPLGQETTFQYDGAGNLTRYVDPRGDSWSFTYDAVGRQTSQTDPLQHVQRFVYDSRDNLVEWTDENGGVTTFEYNDGNLLTRIEDPLGHAEVWSYQYAGGLIQPEYAFTDARGNTWTYDRDFRERITSETDPQGFTQQWTYHGRLLATYRDQAGQLVSYRYDARDRLVGTVDELGGTTTFTYDAVGNRTATTDPLGRTTEFQYDLLNRLVATTDPAGQTIDYTYDAVGNLTALSDSLGNVSRYVYDDLNRLVERTDPLQNRETFQYDAIGNLIRHTDRNGRQRAFTYDALSRLTSEIWLDELGLPTQTFGYAYDPVGNLLAATGPNSNYGLTYDAASRLTSVDNLGTPHVPHLRLDYGYDENGNRTSVTDSLGVTVSSSYDSRNQLSGQSWFGGGIDGVRTEVLRDARGLRTSLSRFDDEAGGSLISRTSYEYDAKARLTRLAHQNALDSVLADYEFTWDVADQLARQVTGGATTEYAYDAVGQLVSADHDNLPNEAYDYDANGNRTGASIEVGANNQILADDTYDYQYDGEGNLVRRTDRATGEVTEYEYDQRNRLVRATVKSAGGVILQASEFTYDVFDRRIATTVDADGQGPLAPETTYSVYDGEHVWVDYVDVGQVIARYLFGESVDELVARWRPAGGTAWYLTDHLGSVRDIIDAAGAIINHLEYDSFGNVIRETNPLAGDRFKFTGREWDAALGFYYYRARFYDPRLGRFVSQDPIGFDAGDSNLYRYVGNAPTQFIDPSGLTATIAYPTPARVAASVASSAAGFAVGFVCGFLEALWRGDQNPLATAAQEAAFASVVSAGVGLTVGAAGAVSGSAGVLLGGFFLGVGLGLEAMNLADEEDVTIRTLRVVCFAAYVVTGAGASRATSRLLRSRALSNRLGRLLANDARLRLNGRLDRLLANDIRLRPVLTPWGTARQLPTTAADDLRMQVESGQLVQRGGNFPNSAANDAQFFSSESPLSPGFANRVGAGNLDGATPDFIMGGRVRSGSNFVTREAPGLGANEGGGLEIVTEPGAVEFEFFVMPE